MGACKLGVVLLPEVVFCMWCVDVSVSVFVSMCVCMFVSLRVCVHLYCLSLCVSAGHWIRIDCVQNLS